MSPNVTQCNAMQKRGFEVFLSEPMMWKNENVSLLIEEQKN